jgi:uncharacterized phosphosugar-binding protein
MTPTKQYFEAVSDLIRTIYENERESIRAAADVLADQVAQGNLIHVFGSGGHSLMGAEELTYRAGGLVTINPILDPGVSLHYGAIRSTIVERTPGYMPGILKYYRVKAGEAIIIVNAYGINAATIDTALEAKRIGLTVIGVTGTHTANLLAPDHPSRHPSGNNLHEIVDIFVNTHVPAGDSVVEIEGFAQKVAAVSTIANAFALESIVAETVNLLVERGIDPPVWMSANLPGGDENNKKYIDQYLGVIKHL